MAVEEAVRDPLELVDKELAYISPAHARVRLMQNQLTLSLREIESTVANEQLVEAWKPGKSALEVALRDFRNGCAILRGHAGSLRYMVSGALGDVERSGPGEPSRALEETYEGYLALVKRTQRSLNDTRAEWRTLKAPFEAWQSGASTAPASRLDALSVQEGSGRGGESVESAAAQAVEDAVESSPEQLEEQAPAG